VFYARELGARAVTLRLTNVYGPGQSDRFLIPRIVGQVLDKQAPEIVVQDLQPRRDFIHVEDAVAGMILSMGAEPGAAFDLGSGIDHSVEEVILLAKRVTGSSKPYRSLGAVRANEIGRTVADARAAREAFGWEPRISLESGILSVVHGFEA
jgi:nucleoside-diphosphate-sugar epimerase